MSARKPKLKLYIGSIAFFVNQDGGVRGVHLITMAVYCYRPDFLSAKSALHRLAVKEVQKANGWNLCESIPTEHQPDLQALGILTVKP